MSKDKNWPRWIISSIIEHFRLRRQGLPFFVEGTHRDDIKDADGIELRIDGPNITEENKNYFYLDCEINILISSIINDINFYRIHEDVGIVSAAFTDIQVFKYGEGIDDDQSLLGCMKLKQSSGDKDKIQVNHFGQISPEIKLLQATIEGHYRLILRT